MKKLVALSMFVSLSVFASSPLPTVSQVEVKEYVGKWYAVTALPQFFTRKCVGQTAEYAIKDAKTISVLNTCIKKNGHTKTIEGQAVVVNPKTNAELEVTFNNFWTRLFRVKGDYNIIKIEEDYSTALVGSKDRKSLWILSRTPYIHEDLKREYLDYARKLNFDTSKVVDSKF